MFGIPYQNLDLCYLPKYPSEIPVLLQSLKQYLVHNKGFEHEGIFRKVGTENEYRDAMEKMDMLENVQSLTNNCYIIGQLIKAFYREYPITCPGFFPETLLQSKDDSTLIAEFLAIAEPNRSMIMWAIDLILETVEMCEENKMTIEAMAICWSVNFLRNEDPNKLLLMHRAVQGLFKKLCEMRLENKLSFRVEPLDCKSEEEEEKVNNEINFGNYNRSRALSFIKRTPFVSYASSVKQMYRPSLNTGVYGTVHYPTRDFIAQGIERQEALHSKEIVLQAMGIHHSPCFQLSFVGDDEDIDIGLSGEELQMIGELRSTLSIDHNYNNVSRSELIRFIIGCKHRLQLAEKRFLNLKSLEREFYLNDIHLHHIRDELKKPCYMLCGRDINGLSIIGFKISKFYSKTSNLSIMMKAVYIWMDAITSDVSVLRKGVVLLMDMQGLTIDNMSLDLEKIFIKAFQEAYPLRMSKIIIVNAPLIVRGAVKVAKLFLKKKMSERIITVKSGPNLWTLVDESQVPECIGGSFDTQYLPNAWAFVCHAIIGDLPLMDVMDDVKEKEELEMESNTNVSGEQETSFTRVKHFGSSFMHNIGKKAKHKISQIQEKRRRTLSNEEMVVSGEFVGDDVKVDDEEQDIYRPDEDMVPPAIDKSKNKSKRLSFKKRNEKSAGLSARTAVAVENAVVDDVKDGDTVEKVVDEENEVQDNTDGDEVVDNEVVDVVDEQY